MSLQRARLILFLIWVTVFVAYMGMFLLATFCRSDVIAPTEARGYAWRSAYILLPILTAFASFWFPEAGIAPAATVPDEQITFHQVIAMFVFTAVGHLILLPHFLFYLFYYDYPSHPLVGESFSDLMDWGFNLLLLLSTIMVAPVGYVLRRRVVLADVPRE